MLLCNFRLWNQKNHHLKCYSHSRFCRNCSHSAKFRLLSRFQRCYGLSILWADKCFLAYFYHQHYFPRYRIYILYVFKDIEACRPFFYSLHVCIDGHSHLGSIRHSPCRQWRDKPEFHQLLIGIILIIGVTAFAGMPFLYHNKTFNREVI